jgi:hypothetical protein
MHHSCSDLVTNFLAADMLVAGYFRSGPAHSDNSTCSLKACKAAEVPKSDQAYIDKFLHKLFLLCSQE